MNDRERSIHLSPVQVLASALASVSAAVLASFFGVAGTVIGAGIASAAASVGGALYSYWIRSTHRAILETLPSALKHTAPSIRPPPGPGSAGPAHGLAGRFEALWSSVLGIGHSLRWRNIAIATVVVFGTAMGVVTAIEVATKQPLSRIVAGSSSGGTTSIGGLVSGGGSSKSPTPPSGTSPSGTPDTTSGGPQPITPQPSITPQQSTTPEQSSTPSSSTTTTSPTPTTSPTAIPSFPNPTP